MFTGPLQIASGLDFEPSGLAGQANLLSVDEHMPSAERIENMDGESANLIDVFEFRSPPLLTGSFKRVNPFTPHPLGPWSW